MSKRHKLDELIGGRDWSSGIVPTDTTTPGEWAAAGMKKMSALARMIMKFLKKLQEAFGSLIAALVQWRTERRERLKNVQQSSSDTEALREKRLKLERQKQREAVLERQRQAKLKSDLNPRISRQQELKQKRKILDKQHERSRQNPQLKPSLKREKKKAVEMDFGR
ncbi:hypothetical protein [Spongiibacter tropicus]|uniref:hypothetical protein n=1 Tax=Spongiibacter tropicus TaxID=454602 RepID=UPI002351F98C|nr:hypothetical protein [Spongiibacter tropicus]|tara:strand:+ start:7340 stop:7837 length:498 start_codon:yes stop_codon:yes gene_type:complete